MLLLLGEGRTEAPTGVNLQGRVGLGGAGCHVGLGVRLDGDVRAVPEHDRLGFELLCRGTKTTIRYWTVSSFISGPTYLSTFDKVFVEVVALVFP